MLSLYISNMTASLFVNKLPKIPWEVAESSFSFLILPDSWLLHRFKGYPHPSALNKYEKYKLSKLKKKAVESSLVT